MKEVKGDELKTSQEGRLEPIISIFVDTVFCE